ncbi:retrovirus-related pol polyprotein from transposon RE1 [Tanacetum coccineum]|uniref:Retrovirus-related pol polyprotein from transposon RE1 n=1 Tax=Tanacetum coccineum TaxID=301880 RepID=A0ABQ4ZTD7_9ASTR
MGIKAACSLGAATRKKVSHGSWTRQITSNWRIMEYLDHDQNSSTTIFCDNSSTVELSRNPVLHGRSKHIDVRFHFLRELTRDNVVRLVHCPTQDQVADIMTKPLKLDLFTRFRSLMGVCADPNVN